MLFFIWTGKYLILFETDEDEGDILHHKQKKWSFFIIHSTKMSFNAIIKASIPLVSEASIVQSNFHHQLEFNDCFCHAKILHIQNISGLLASALLFIIPPIKPKVCTIYFFFWCIFKLVPQVSNFYPFLVKFVFDLK